jgi:hypothetical protein
MKADPTPKQRGSREENHRGNSPQRHSQTCSSASRSGGHRHFGRQPRARCTIPRGHRGRIRIRGESSAYRRHLGPVHGSSSWQVTSRSGLASET